MSRLRPLFPKSHGRPRVDDRRVLRGIIFILRNRLRWWDAPREYEHCKTLYNRWRSWCHKGICSDSGRPLYQTLGRKEHHNGYELLESAPNSFQFAINKGGVGRQIERMKGGMNTKLRAFTDAHCRPIRLNVTAGQISDYEGAAHLFKNLPKDDWLFTDRGYDADWFRKRLKDKEIKPCIPRRKNCEQAIKNDKRRYKRRNHIEIMFGRLNDCRRTAGRYDRCQVVFRASIISCCSNLRA
ncbi:IS5 family transposase [Brucella thiophenivorans]|uniref:IS5 family transposase n=1 Tax=Brucella thiophenivorans TaxID=571255 RepID=UPI001F48C9BD|nr:IS5 family transposase [Brucella thiophenivorans]